MRDRAPETGRPTRNERTPTAAPDRRQALVVAAYQAIAAKGFEGLRLRDVAAAAGIDHSTLHHHFATKRDLIAAVVEYATGQFRKPSPGTPTTLREHLAFLARMIVEQPTLHVVLRELDLRAIRDRSVRDVIAEHEHGWRRALSARLQAAVREGVCSKDLDPEAGAEMVIALVKGASLNPAKAAEVLGAWLALLESASGVIRPRAAKRRGIRKVRSARR